MKILRILLFGFFVSSSFAQTVDSNFNPEFLRPGAVFDILPVEDGKVIIAGNFSRFSSVQKTALIRLNADGTVDETFNTGTGPGMSTGDLVPDVTTIVKLTDGKFLIAGNFYTYDGVKRARLARLNANGTLDQTFTPPLLPEQSSEFNSSSSFIVMQPDGKILTVQGSFTSPGGVSTFTQNVVRLNSNGTLDDTFTSVPVTTGIFDIALQADGKILVGGNFTSYGNTSTNYIIRLKSDGTVDNTFMIGTGAASAVNKIAVRPNGKIILAGYFASFNGATKSRIVQLNDDGTTDASFMGSLSQSILDLKVEAAGTLLIAGNNGRVARLNEDGTEDKSFTGSPDEVNESLFSAAVLDDGKILAGGNSLGYGNNLVRLNSDFTLDDTFEPGIGPVVKTQPGVLVSQTDGKVVMLGDFKYYNGVDKGSIVRLNADLTVDDTFETGKGLSDLYVISAIVQPDNQLIIQSQADKFNDVSFERMIRLNTDGSIDNTFSASTSTFSMLTMTTNGKIIGYGPYARFNGSLQTYLVRLNANGTNDDTFTPKFDGGVLAAVAMKNGKVVASGSFTKLNDVSVPNLVRVNEDGTRDETFVPKIDHSLTVISNMQETADGKVMLFGSIAVTENSATKRYIAARLLDNGDLDGSFELTEQGAGIATARGFLLADRSFLIATLNYELIRLYPDGKVSSLPRPKANTSITQFTQPSATSVIISGYFNKINDQPASVARITFDEVVAPSAPTNLTAVLSAGAQVILDWTAGSNATSYEIEKATDGDFEKAGVSQTNTYEVTGLNDRTSYKFRVRSVGPGGFSDYSNEATIETILGLEGDAVSFISVHPNPANEMLYVSGGEHASLMDALGRTISTHNKDGEKISIHLKDVQPGIYLVKVKSQAGTSVHRVVRN